MGNVIGKGDHRAAAAPGSLLSNLPFRTFLQGLAINVIQVIALIVIEMTKDGKAIDWNLFLGTVITSVMYAIASYVMAKLRPPTVIPPEQPGV